MLSLQNVTKAFEEIETTVLNDRTELIVLVGK
jgi:hypothetical protein